VRCLPAAVAALLPAAALCGCSPAPLRLSETDPPQLHAVEFAFQHAVDDAHHHPELHWHSGWFGNALVNLGGTRTLGLCHHWQEWIYQQVAPAVRDVGWEVCGIAVNVGDSGEHHAVFVYNPQRLGPANLLLAPRTAPAYVLDAWRRGRADIYRLDDWLALPLRITVPPQLEDLPGDGPLPFAPPGSPPAAATPAAPNRELPEKNTDRPHLP